jgi:hypothetical protein
VTESKIGGSDTMIVAKAAVEGNKVKRMWNRGFELVK